MATRICSYSNSNNNRNQDKKIKKWYKIKVTWSRNKWKISNLICSLKNWPTIKKIKALFAPLPGPMEIIK